MAIKAISGLDVIGGDGKGETPPGRRDLASSRPSPAGAPRVAATSASTENPQFAGVRVPPKKKGSSSQVAYAQPPSVLGNPQPPPTRLTGATGTLLQPRSGRPSQPWSPDFHSRRPNFLFPASSESEPHGELRPPQTILAPPGPSPAYKGPKYKVSFRFWEVV
jgi:hypothetical protein